MKARSQIKPESRGNPNIKTSVIGIRELKTVKIYPLSAAFNLDMAEKVSDLLVGFFSLDFVNLKDDEASQKIATFFIDIIRSNIKDIITHAVDLKELRDQGIRSVDDLMDDISFSQLTDISEIIYDVNYKNLVGKVTGFLEKRRKQEMKRLLEATQEAGKAQPTIKPSPSSAESTEGTESKTSGNRTMKEE